MHSYRITTNGLYRTYRTNLNKNNKMLGDSMTTVETSRNFNTYAEDPAAASKAWRLRRSYWRTNDQIDNSNYAVSKFESAYSAMASIIDGDAGNGDFGLGLDGLVSTIRGITGSAGASRVALGKELLQTADNMVSMLNTKYGDEFVFAGADGLNVPFEWNEDKTKLLYRGLDVGAAQPRTFDEFGITKENLKGLEATDLLLKAPVEPKAPVLEATPPAEVTSKPDRSSFPAVTDEEYQTILNDYDAAMRQYYYPFQTPEEKAGMSTADQQKYDLSVEAMKYAVDLADYEKKNSAYQDALVQYAEDKRQYDIDKAKYDEDLAAYEERYNAVKDKLETLRAKPVQAENEDDAAFGERLRVYQGIQNFTAYADEYEKENALSYEEGLENYEKLQSMANETTYIDVGLGMKERDDKLIPGSAFNSAVSGLSFLGFGKDENLVMVVKELGEIFSASDPDNGAYASPEDEKRADELLDRLQEGVRYAQDRHTQLSADAKYLKTNLEQLKLNKSELDSQIVDTEDMDMAEAITNMNWAQYCYNAALRIGTNLLSQSLIDYMN